MNVLHHLYRFDCPTVAELRNYAWHDLDARSHAAIRTHVDMCALCREELSELENVAQEPTLPEATAVTNSPHQRALTHAKVFLDHARLVIATSLSAPTMQTAGAFRAGASSVTRRNWSKMLQADDAMISIAAVPDGQDCYTLAVRVFADTPGQSLRCRLITDDGTVTPRLASTGDDATVTFSAVSSGEYSLVLRLPHSVVLAPNLLLE